MKMISSGKRCSSLKGFTLIEMIVVIAIIGVLMSMLSLAISGFTNDARRETADEQARMVSQSFQSLLTEYEIRGMTIDNVKYTDSSGNKQSLLCNTLADNLIVRGDSSTETISRNGASSLGKEAYDAVTKNFEPGFQGSFYISYNTFSYSVKYTLYTELTSAKANSTMDGISQAGVFQLSNRDEQKSILDTKNIVIGCYPYSDDMA